LSAIYLTEELTDGSQTELIPIVVYPEESELWQARVPLRLPANQNSSYLLADANARVKQTSDELRKAVDAQVSQATSQGADLAASALSLLKQQRIVLPLIHENLVLGLLVVGREDRQWNAWEQAQLEQIAHTLAIACILDQRYQWLEHSNYYQRSLQAQQHNTLANLLHQFRNPLTTLRTLGKLLLNRLMPADTNRKIATSIVQESDRLEQLLQQFDVAINLGEAALEADLQVEQPAQPPSRPLLPAAGLTTGTQLQLQPCWVSEVLEPLLISASAIAETRNLHLQVEIPPDLPPVQADARALREVLSNLIDNALKYTSPGGQIQVQLSQQSANTHPGNDQVIAVSNTGPEIPEQDLHHIFERHYRGIQAQSDIPGTGLGLAIARELVEQMQGQIQVFSPAHKFQATNLDLSLESGSMFVVVLPEIQRFAIE
jgi:hypothetical protein